VRELFSLSLSLVVIVPLLAAQNPTSTADTNEYRSSCRTIAITLRLREIHREPGDPPVEDDDFTAAGKACEHLKAASSDPAKIAEATKELHPILASLGMPPTNAQEQFASAQKKVPGLKREDLFDELPDLAKRAFNAGEIAAAQSYSKELLQMAAQYPKEWNYGNAIFYGNFVLGRIALKQGNLKEADKYLLEAGKTPGSPQLDSFGPNMSLAKELLEKGESDAVLQFLDSCNKFWEMGQQELGQWSSDIRAGKTPDFRHQLNY